MTQTPDRPGINDLNSDMLDQLYTRLDAAEREADEAVAAAAHLARLVGKRSEKAERNAEKQSRRARSAETELRTLRCGLRANGADPTQVQNLWAQIHLRNRQWGEEKQRAEQAEATLAAVRELHDRWECDANVCAVCVDGYGTPVPYPCPTVAVLDQHGQTPKEPATHVGGNAEDCRACEGTNLPYPFICPGTDDGQTPA